VPAPAAPPSAWIECLAAELLSKEIGVLRIGGAVNEMPLVEVQCHMMQGAARQILEKF
jgi:hypothetical protein